MPELENVVDYGLSWRERAERAERQLDYICRAFGGYVRAAETVDARRVESTRTLEAALATEKERRRKQAERHNALHAGCQLRISELSTALRAFVMGLGHEKDHPMPITWCRWCGALAALAGHNEEVTHEQRRQSIEDFKTEAEKEIQGQREVLEQACHVANTGWEEAEAGLERAQGFPGSNQQRCRTCGRADGIDWGVPNDVWERAGGEGVLCLPCFDRLAVVAGIETYRLTHLYYVSDIGLGPEFDDVDRDRHEWVGRYHESQERLERARAALRQLRPMVEAFESPAITAIIEDALASVSQGEATSTTDRKENGDVHEMPVRGLPDVQPLREGTATPVRREALDVPDVQGDGDPAEDAQGAWPAAIGGCEHCARVTAERDRLQEFGEWAAQLQPQAVAIMRREGFVLDDLDDRMQKLAFTFYSDLVEIAAKWDALVDASTEEGAALADEGGNE